MVAGLPLFGVCFLVCLVVGLCFWVCWVVGLEFLFHFYVVLLGCGCGCMVKVFLGSLLTLVFSGDFACVHFYGWPVSVRE